MKSTFTPGAVQDVVLDLDKNDPTPPVWKIRSLSFGDHFEWASRFDALFDVMPPSGAPDVEHRAWIKKHREVCLDFLTCVVVGARDLPAAIDGLSFPLDDVGRSVLTRTNLRGADGSMTTLMAALTRAARDAQTLTLDERRSLPGSRVDAGG